MGAIEPEQLYTQLMGEGMKLKSIILALSFLIINAAYAVLNEKEPSIVFVHIGERLPDYLESAIKQARMFNSCNIIVVANEKAFQQANGNLEKYDTLCVACESLDKTFEHFMFMYHSTLDKYFRNGFWNHATERFFYLQDVMQKFNLSSVIHIENDNMFYVDVYELLPVFKEHYPHIGLTMDNDGRCIPGIVYIADKESMDHLAEYIAKFAFQGRNDMEIIASYYKEFGFALASQLPIIMKEYVIERDLVSPYGHFAQNKWNYCQYADAFSSIFDGAAIGQYLGGIDPRNGPSVPGFINESCVFNPSLLVYSWKTDERNRKVPYASYRGVEYRINNLHVHSKDLVQFLSDRE